MAILQIEKIRKEKGMTLAVLSEKSGIRIGYLSELETGKKKNPSLATLIAISEALECKTNDLIFDGQTECKSPPGGGGEARS